MALADPVPWPFFPGGEFVEQLDSRTDILPAATGPEQRIRLRPEPHVRLTFDGLAEADERRWLENLLNANGDGRWWVPWPMEGQALAAPLSLGGTTIGLDTRWRHFVAGGQALLVGATPRQHALVSIDSLTDEVLELAEPLDASWPAGTLVYPVMPARLDGMLELPRFTGDAGAYQVKWRADAAVAWPAAFGELTYRGVPVLDLPLEWTQDPLDVPERTFTTVDDGLALPFAVDQAGQPRNRIRVACTVQGLEAAAQLRSLLYALGGSWGALWVPSLAHDFRVVGNVLVGATALDVAWAGYSLAAPAQNRRDIRITLWNGTTYYRRITGATELSATTERVTLDSALPAAFLAVDVAQVAFLQLCRQEADVNVLRWWTSDVVRTTLEFRGEVAHGV
ncbi:hypothetical protein [uncultured Luteimonas sp.]|uniref:hypothetical protein n=1 Tax=uncultured Luteimonas sp. TaxID=453144 RepID=UPI0026357DEA|nr:hypothetical protein [uncultured Luteimonas sp.]